MLVVMLLKRCYNEAMLKLPKFLCLNLVIWCLLPKDSFVSIYATCEQNCGGHPSLLMGEDVKVQVCCAVFTRFICDLTTHIRAILLRYDVVSLLRCLAPSRVTPHCSTPLPPLLLHTCIDDVVSPVSGTTACLLIVVA